LTDELIQKAFDDITIPDFEDCIQYLSAKTTFCDAIITRNVKDFKKADIKAYTPEDFLSVIT
jgi:predicted nucleic acid-binding protein